MTVILVETDMDDVETEHDSVSRVWW